MRKILLIALLSIYSLISAKNFVLKGLVYPKQLLIQDNLLFVNDHAERVKVYDLKTKKLLNEFGKSGEGPGEFLSSGKKMIQLKIFNSQLLVESYGRLSLFKFNGKYIKDIKLPMGYINIMPINQNSYILGKVIIVESDMYQTVLITDKEFKKQLEIARKKFPKNFSKKEINAFTNFIRFETYGEKIFLVDTEEFEIKIIDGKTKKINKFKHPYKRRKVSSKDKKEFANRYKKKKFKITYPDYFPAIKNIMCDKDNLYVITNKKEGIKQEILVFNHKGKFKKGLSLKLEQEDEKHIYPYILYNLKLYQIVEKDEDNWELQITDF